MIVAGASTQTLAAELAAETGRDLATVTTKTFPDGERYVRIQDDLTDNIVLNSAISAEDDSVSVQGDLADAIVVASTVSDGDFVELLQLQDAAREAGANKLTSVIPYMGYARQDRAFEPGEAVSARAMARAIASGTDRVLTVNPHERAVCEYFDVPADPVDAAGVLADPLPNLADPLFLAPDEGAIDLATTVRDAVGAGETDYFEKTRHSGNDVEIRPSDADVADRDVVLVDDIIATGSTMSESVTVLDSRDANRIFVTCVHPLLARDAYSKLVRAGVDAIYGTDTIERAASEVSVAPVVAEHL